MIRALTSVLFIVFSLLWIFPILILEIFRLGLFGFNTEGSILLLVGLIFSYLILNLRRDRIDVSKHYELLSFVKKYEDDACFELIETNRYITLSQFSSFLEAYTRGGVLSGLVNLKARKFVTSRVRIVLISPKLANKFRLPSGLKSFPSAITHQTVIFTINHPDKLNPLLRFAINHELGHMHKYALSNVSMREIGTFPFLWLLFWATFTVEFNVLSIGIMVVIALIVIASELKNEDSKFNTRERIDAEIASDFIGLKLLSEEDLNHPVFEKIKFTDPDLDEKENELRNKGFRLILSKLKEDKDYELPDNFHFRKRVILLILFAFLLGINVTESSGGLIKFAICLCIFIQAQRFVNHREINRVLANIKSRTGVDLSRFREKNSILN